MIKAMRAYTGAIILHDGLPSGNANGNNQYVWIGRDRFGIEADDVEFIGYWVPGSGAGGGAKRSRFDSPSASAHDVPDLLGSHETPNIVSARDYVRKPASGVGWTARSRQGSTRVRSPARK